MSSSFSVRSDRFICLLPYYRSRHARDCPGHPRFSLSRPYEDVDGRDPSTPEASTGFDCRSAEALAKAAKPGHDACLGPSETDAITNSDLPIRTTGTLRGS